MNADKKLSVIVPTYNRRQEVARLLSALSDQSLPADDFEVVVAIDGSLDGTQRLVDEYRTHYHVQGIWQKNAGRAAACNAGVKHARGKLLLFLDDDMEPARECLASHLVAHQQSAVQVVIGPIPLAINAQSPPLLKFLDAKVASFLERLAQAGYRVGPRDFFSSNFSISRSLFLQLGGFDDSFRIYGNEDVELAFRLLAASIPIVFQPEAVARQHYLKDFAALARDSVDKGRSAVLLASKHPSARTALEHRRAHDLSGKWRVFRTTLLGVSGSGARPPEWVLRVIDQLERKRSPSLYRIYPLALDYFFWLGVRAACREDRARRVPVTSENSNGPK